MFDRGADIRTIQTLLKQEKLETTASYTRVATGLITAIQSPLDQLDMPQSVKAGKRRRGKSCRNRHCLKCQGAAARDWLEDREAELLPVPYFHVVYTLPAPIADLAYTNKAVIYDILFKASAQATLTIAAHGFQLPSFLLQPGEMHDAHHLNTRRTCASHCKLVRRRCLGR
jgi:hypothetical protein